MKAITCSQCGALLKGISTKKELADCIYCGAEIPIRKEKVFEVSDKKAEEEEKKQKRLREKIRAMRKVEHDEWKEDLAKDHERTNKRLITWTIGFIIICILPFLMYYLFHK